MTDHYVREHGPAVECPGCEEACVLPCVVATDTQTGKCRAYVECPYREDVARVVVPLPESFSRLEREVIAGYHDGFSGEPEPGDNRSDAYRHGWRSGADDRAGKPTRTAAQARAAWAAIVAKEVAA